MTVRQACRSAVWWLALLLAVPCAARASSSGLGPGDAAKTLGTLSVRCFVQALCPLDAVTYDLLKRAVAGNREAQFFVGLRLAGGSGAPMDPAAGTAWAVKAAEAGSPAAARYVERRLQNGDDVPVDETRIAAALKAQADRGDTASMLALGPMMIRGRGTAQDPQAGIAMLRRAGEHDPTGGVAYQIAELFLVGTNGLPHDHEEGMRWYTIAANRGHLDAMATLGGLWENRPLNDLIEAMQAGPSAKPVFEPDIVQSYCWRMRAAMMGKTLAQYELALMLTRRNSDRRGNVIEPDLIEADYWFRLGARDPDYNNAQVRAAIEPKMTTVQLDQAKKRAADWRPLDFDRMKAVGIAIPGDTSRACPPMT